jgi:lipid A 3-O-deacylase
MKCILTATSIAILVATTAQAGLVTDDAPPTGGNPMRPQVAQPSEVPEAPEPEAIAPNVAAPEATPASEAPMEEKGAPVVDDPKTVEPEVTTPTKPEDVTKPAVETTAPVAETETVVTEEAPATTAEVPETEVVEAPATTAEVPEAEVVEAPATTEEVPEAENVEAVTEAAKGVDETTATADAPAPKQMDAPDAEKPAPSITTAPLQAPAEVKQVKTKKKRNRGKRAIFIAGGISDGGSNVRAGAIGMDLFASKTWLDLDKVLVTSYLELLASYWKGDEGHTGVTDIHEGGVTGYLRFIGEKHAGGTIRPYVDLGAGGHFLNDDKIESKELGGQWMIGSNLGLGLVLGEDDQFDIGIRLRHLSNGGTEEINWGINHYMIRMAFRL